MLVDTLYILSVVALGLFFTAVITLLQGRVMLSGILSILSMIFNYIAAVGWMQPQVLTSAGTLLELEAEKGLSGLFMGTTYVSFALLASSIFLMILGFSGGEEE